MAYQNSEYNAPEHQVTREKIADRVAVTSSTLYFAQFLARAKMYVTNVIVGVRSAASLPALTMIVGHKISAMAAFSNVAGTTTAWISANSVGSYQTATINRTLATGEAIGLVFTDAKGKFYVSYEYTVLPNS